MRIRKRLLAVLLSLCLLSQLFAGFTALATGDVSTGTVKVSDALRVRSEPNTDSEVVGYLKNNDTVTIHETVKAENGEQWYRISTGDLTGYAHSNYITVNAVYKTDEEFEAYLTAQGFPEDYKVALRQVHAQYPNWVFRAQTLSMTWAEALKAECAVGLNTVASPDAWKSMEYGAYNWETNSYVVFDSGGWVSASPEVIAYYMDPRNWLDSTYIFQFEDLSYADDQTVDGIKAILPTALDKHAGDLLKASKETGVSAYFLATRMAQEGSHLNGLGTGTVKGYEGYYNFFSYGAYAANGLSAVQNGAIYAKNQGWDTPYKCLKGSAERIGKYYINLGQNTLYYQKFNLTNTASGLYAHQYMSNIAAPSSEGCIRRNAASADQLSNNITFNIPVFKSMPETVAPMPSKEGNNDNFLTDITLIGSISATQNDTTSSDTTTSTSKSSSTSKTSATSTTTSTNKTASTDGASSTSKTSSTKKTSSTGKTSTTGKSDTSEKVTVSTTASTASVDEETSVVDSLARIAGVSTSATSQKAKTSETDNTTSQTNKETTEPDTAAAETTTAAAETGKSTTKVTAATTGSDEETTTITEDIEILPTEEVELTLTPSFDRYTLEYFVHAGDATSIKISAALSNSDAKLTGDGTVRLYKGDNEIPLTVTATSGATRTYTLIVTTNGGVERPNAPVITGKAYTVSDDNTITKVEPNTSVADFIDNLAVSKGTALVCTADGDKKDSGIIGTGDIVRLYSGKTLCASYTVVIYGDVNGDGKVSSLDLRIAQKHILELTTVDGYYLTAADSSKDGNLSSLDLRITQKYILKITKTLQ